MARKTRDFGSIEWDRKDDLKSSWLAVCVSDFSYDNTENWKEHFQAIANRIKKLQEIVKKYL